MNWKRAAEEDLKKYASQKLSLDNMAERISILQDRFTSLKGVTTDSTPVQGGGGTQIEDRLLDNIVERERLKATYHATKRIVNLMDRGLSALDEKEKRALDMFYVYKQKNHVERLMDEWKFEKSQVYNIKDKALYKYTIAMYGLIDY